MFHHTDIAQRTPAAPPKSAKRSRSGIAERRVFSRYLTNAEERQLFATVDRLADLYARRDAAWMRLLRTTGIRVGTLAGLTVGDAQEALAGGYLLRRPEISKGGRGGKTYLTQTARKALRDLLRIRAEMGADAALDEPLVVSRKHRRMSVRSFQSRMRLWCRQAGLSVEASPHWLGHYLPSLTMPG